MDAQNDGAPLKQTRMRKKPCLARHSKEATISYVSFSFALSLSVCLSLSLSLSLSLCPSLNIVCSFCVPESRWTAGGTESQMELATVDDVEWPRRRRSTTMSSTTVGRPERRRSVRIPKKTKQTTKSHGKPKWNRKPRN